MNDEITVDILLHITLQLGFKLPLEQYANLKLKVITTLYIIIISSNILSVKIIFFIPVAIKL